MPRSPHSPGSCSRPQSVLGKGDKSTCPKRNKGPIASFVLSTDKLSAISFLNKAFPPPKKVKSSETNDPNLTVVWWNSQMEGHTSTEAMLGFDRTGERPAKKKKSATLTNKVPGYVHSDSLLCTQHTYTSTLIWVTYTRRSTITPTSTNTLEANTISYPLHSLYKVYKSIKRHRRQLGKGNSTLQG